MAKSNRVVGRLMPSRTPSKELNTRTVVGLDPATAPFAIVPTQITPQRMRAIVSQAEHDGDVGPLYDVYDRMAATDAMYGGIEEQIKAAVAGFKLKVAPPATTSETDRALADDYADLAREVIACMNQHEVTRGFTAAHFSGAKLYFNTWALKNYAYGRTIWLPNAPIPVRGRHLAVETKTKDPNVGELCVRPSGGGKLVCIKDLPEESYILLQKDDARHRYHAIGATRKCLSWYLGIQYVVSWQIQYIEGWAAPRRIGKYPRGTGKEAKAELEHFLRTLGNNGYALFPNDMELILEEANRQGTVTTYSDFIRMGHSQYAISLLGQSDTVGGGSDGGYAKSVVSNSIRYEVLQEVAAHVSRGWETLVGQTIRANYGENVDERLFPKIAPVIITPQEMATKTTTFVSLQASGVPVPEDYAFEQILGIDPPMPGEFVYAFGQRFRFDIDPFPEPPSTGADAAIKPESNRKNRDGDAPIGSRSVANDPNEQK